MADQGAARPGEAAAIDVEFQPIRRARERVAPAQIVSAESLQSQTVTPVVWLRVPEPDGPSRSRLWAEQAPQIPPFEAEMSWLDDNPGHRAAAVLVSLDSARRASYGGFDHAHRAGDCAICRRAVASYR